MGCELTAAPRPMLTCGRIGDNGQWTMRDQDVRRAVRRRLDAKYGPDPDARIVEEMGIWSGSVRIDLAVINGELCGYELKSDRDTLQRLPFQAELYSKVFDRVELIIASRHAEHATKLVPDWWRITIARMKGDEVALSTVPGRLGRRNRSIDPLVVAQLLWKNEALAILEAHGAVRGYRSKRIGLIHKRVAEVLNGEELRREVRRSLKERPANWLRQQVPDKFEVPIDADLDPVLQPLWGCSIGNSVDLCISPTIGERSSS